MTTAKTTMPATFTRWTALRKEDLDEKRREVAASFSSEEPVTDFFEPVVLLHESKAADFAPLRELGSVLLNHNPDKIVGAPLNVRLDKRERKGRAVIRFDDDEGITADNRFLTVGVAFQGLTHTRGFPFWSFAVVFFGPGQGIIGAVSSSFDAARNSHVEDF